MELTPSDVTKIAQLARLELDTDEQAQLHLQLNDFFSIVQAMRAVDTTGIDPLYTPLAAIEDVSLRLRADEVTETENRQACMINAPASDAGYFLVPKVIE